MQLPEFLTKKYFGILPGWAIAGGAIAAIGAYLWLHKSTSTPGAAASGTAGGAASPSDFLGGGGGGGTGGNPPLSCGHGTQPDPTGTFCIPIPTLPVPTGGGNGGGGITPGPAPGGGTYGVGSGGVITYTPPSGLVGAVQQALQPAPAYQPSTVPATAPIAPTAGPPSIPVVPPFLQRLSTPPFSGWAAGLLPNPMSPQVPLIQSFTSPFTASGGYNPFGNNAPPAVINPTVVPSSTFGSGPNAFQIAGHYEGDPNNGGAVWVPA